MSPKKHGGTLPVPMEYMLDPDPELRLVWAPLVTGGSCKYEACESDEACTCQEPLEETDDA